MSSRGRSGATVTAGDRAGNVASLSLDPQTRQIAQRMRQEVPVKDRSYHLRTYKRCFVGREAAKWLRDMKYAQSSKEAEEIGNRILQAGLIAHCVDPDHIFEDAYLFYRWINDAQPVPEEVKSPSNSVAGGANDWVMPDLVKDVQMLEDRLRGFEATLAKTQAELRLMQAVFGGFLICMVLWAVWRMAGPIVAFTICIAALGVLFWHLRQSSHAVDNAVCTPPSECDVELPDDEVQKRIATAQVDIRRVYPEYADLFTAHYIKSVLQAPDKKDPSKPRTFAYGRDKLLAALKFRKEHELDCITHSNLGNTLDCGSLYWHGYDDEGRPILWVRPLLKDWKNINVEDELRLHAFMIDYGTTIMPPHVSSMTLVADATGMGLTQASPALMKALLKLLTEAYPGRLGKLYVGPVNVVVRSLFSVLKPLLPRNLISKIELMADPNKRLAEALGADNVPSHFDGPAQHFVGEAGFSFNVMDQEMKRQYQQRFAAAAPLNQPLLNQP